jgi:hypothetical protein
MSIAALTGIMQVTRTTTREEPRHGTHNINIDNTFRTLSGKVVNGKSANRYGLALCLSLNCDFVRLGHWPPKIWNLEG